MKGELKAFALDLVKVTVAALCIFVLPSKVTEALPEAHPIAINAIVTGCWLVALTLIFLIVSWRPRLSVAWHHEDQHSALREMHVQVPPSKVCEQRFRLEATVLRAHGPGRSLLKLGTKHGMYVRAFGEHAMLTPIVQPFDGPIEIERARGEAVKNGFHVDLDLLPPVPSLAGPWATTNVQFRGASRRVERPYELRHSVMGDNWIARACGRLVIVDCPTSTIIERWS